MKERELSNKITCAVLDGEFFTKTLSASTHALKHVQADDITLLDRVLAGGDDKKAFSSGFDDTDAYEQAVSECVLDYSDNIARWVLEDSGIKRAAFTVELPPEDYGPAGYGYMLDKKDNRIRYCSTQAVCMVLEKEKASPLGFTMLTAYPDISRGESRTDIKDEHMDETLKQTDAYKMASPVKKLYMHAQVSDNSGYLITFKPGKDGLDDVMSVQIPFKDDKGAPCRHMLRIRQSGMEFLTQRLSKMQVIRNGKKEQVITADTDVAKLLKTGGRPGESQRFVKVETGFSKRYGQNGKTLLSDRNADAAVKEIKKKYPALSNILDMAETLYARDGPYGRCMGKRDKKEGKHMSIIEKEKNILDELRETDYEMFDGDRDEALDFIAARMKAFAHYVNTVVTMQSMMPIWQVMSDGQDYRDKVQDADSRRKMAHDSCITSVNSLNRLCSSLNLPPFAEIDGNDRHAVAEFAGRVVTEIYADATQTENPYEKENFSYDESRIREEMEKLDAAAAAMNTRQSAQAQLGG